ncbi:MAG: putative glycoside hydrolase [Betaproteobacteria bacterium]|nr:putative glycoside hydrolase [Betaproteobacteria bacterium]
MSGFRLFSATARLAALLAGVFSVVCASGAEYRGRVVDAATGQVLQDAAVTLGDRVARSDEYGAFRIEGEGDAVGVRAWGYLRRSVPASLLLGGGTDVALTPFSPKALYLSFYGIGSRSLRESALELADKTEINALVIDVKGDRGMVAYRSAVPLAAQAGAQKVITVKDVRGLVASLRARGLYTIARIVTFKDNPLALARPDLAVKTRDGRVWRDRENLAWTDPFRREVRDYNLALAEEAAAHGFDEIQFDYVRFPDAPELVYAERSTEESRVRAVGGFLAEARKRLAPYNVFLAADTFGYVAWNPDDTYIGQRLEDLERHLDYISLMLYPSGFHLGIPGYRNPVAHPYEIVRLTLNRARARTGLPPVRFRPWLQAFRDYAFDRRRFGGAEIRAQIRAAEEFGANGWMLWNPNNVYSEEGLRAAARWPAPGNAGR